MISTDFSVSSQQIYMQFSKPPMSTQKVFYIYVYALPYMDNISKVMQIDM